MRRLCLHPGATPDATDPTLAPMMQRHTELARHRVLGPHDPLAKEL